MESPGPAPGTKVPPARPPLNIDVRYDFGEAAQVPRVDPDSLFPLRQPEALEAVSVQVSGD